MDDMDAMDAMDAMDTSESNFNTDNAENEDPAVHAARRDELLATLGAQRRAAEEKEAATLAAEHTHAKEAADKARQQISDEAIDEYGIQPDADALMSYDDDDLPDTEVGSPMLSPQTHNRDLFGSLSNYHELTLEVAKNMDPKALLNLYCICRDFNEVLNGHIGYFVRACAKHQVPVAAKLYNWKFYHSLSQLDPIPRRYANGGPVLIRRIPSLKWLQMIVHREKTVRDILACMARQGHRTPATMNLSLKKTWFVMDIATSARRAQVMHNEDFMTDEDLWNLQLFIVKLDMRFNDPIDGSGSDILRKLLLGQRGLTPLCKALKRKAFTSRVEALKASIRYAYAPRPEHRNMPIWDIPPNEIGIGHLEGWGKGRCHLMRIDELVAREATRRALDFKNWIMPMMLWGYVDPITGLNTPATEEEKYMSDDEGPEGGSRIINWPPPVVHDNGEGGRFTLY